MKAAVFGSGAGALAVAADLSRHGNDVTMCDLVQFQANLEPVREQGGVRVLSGWADPQVEPVTVADDPATAGVDAEALFVVVPAFGHQPWAEALVPIAASEQVILFFGEGGGAIVARLECVRRGLGRLLLAETNTLPYVARVVVPGTVAADRKSGGVLLAALPSDRTPSVVELVQAIWPYISPAESVWETVLVNYNAIDHVATVVANAGTLENRTGGMLLWGEGATPSVVRVIEAVDRELLEVRSALGLQDRRRYRDFLIEQGFAPDVGPQLFEVVRASRLTQSAAPTGAGALETRYITEDVPFSLVFAASIALEVGVETPVIDGLVAIASAMLGRNLGTGGRTLETLGLRGLGPAGLRSFAETGEVPQVDPNRA